MTAAIEAASDFVSSLQIHVPLLSASRRKPRILDWPARTRLCLLPNLRAFVTSSRTTSSRTNRHHRPQTTHLRPLHPRTLQTHPLHITHIHHGSQANQQCVVLPSPPSLPTVILTHFAEELTDLGRYANTCFFDMPSQRHTDKYSVTHPRHAVLAPSATTWYVPHHSPRAPRHWRRRSLRRRQG